MDVPGQGSWVVFTEAGGVFIVEGSLNWLTALEISFNLVDREESVLIWHIGKGRNTRDEEA